jgi:PRTRC genetic system ThiF family protein
MIHHIDPELLRRPVQVVLVGAGGTGSHVMRRLPVLHNAMIDLGHPGGLDVTVYDPDVVSKTNVGRQAFSLSDVGLSKAEILVHRCNMGHLTNWEARQEKFTAHSPISADIVIGCVDNRAGRKEILSSCESSYQSRYWLDFGNRAHDGQVILGQIIRKSALAEKGAIRLPHVANLYPELVDASLDDKDETPSCSLAEALEKQSLFINDTLALVGITMLQRLFRYGQLSYHGEFINSEVGRVNPLAVDPEAWKRFGYEPKEAKPKRTRSKKFVS